MDNVCCRNRSSEMRDVASPFRRLVVTGYYDGPTDGLLECNSCSTVYVFKKLDWDGGQDMRIFSLAAATGQKMDDIWEALPPEMQNRSTWIVTPGKNAAAERIVEAIEGSTKAQDVVVAARDLLGNVAVWRPFWTLDVVDWFAELGLSR